MEKIKKKPFWNIGMSWPTVLGMAIGLGIANLITDVNKHNTETDAKIRLKEMQQSTLEMSEEEHLDFENLRNETRSILFNKLSPEETQRASYLTDRFAKGVARYEEMEEWSRLLNKAKRQLSPEEKEIFERYEKLVSKM